MHVHNPSWPHSPPCLSVSHVFEYGPWLGEPGRWQGLPCLGSAILTGIRVSSWKSTQSLAIWPSAWRWLVQTYNLSQSVVQHLRNGSTCHWSEMMIFDCCFVQGWLKNFQHLLRHRYLLCSQVLGPHESLVILSDIVHMGEKYVQYISLS